MTTLRTAGRRCGSRIPADRARAGPGSERGRGDGRLDPAEPVLLVTGDHPLLQPAWLEQFVSRAAASGADAVVGLVDHAVFVARFPDSRRTRYRFSDVSVCGTNLFYFAGQRGRAVVEQWRRRGAPEKTLEDRRAPRAVEPAALPGRKAFAGAAMEALSRSDGSSFGGGDAGCARGRGGRGLAGRSRAGDRTDRARERTGRESSGALHRASAAAPGGGRVLRRAGDRAGVLFQPLPGRCGGRAAFAAGGRATGDA